MSPQGDKLVDDYLKQLNRKLRDLPRARRRELVDEIAEHISAARADLEVEDEAAMRTILERLGSPEDIAAEALGRSDARPRGVGWKEVGALILVPIGGVIVPVLGWFVGIALLWISDAWGTREKVLGTLLFPGGLLIPAALGVFASESSSCGTVVNPQLSPQTGAVDCPPGGGTEAWEIALVATLVIVPILMVVYLARRMRRLTPTAA